MAPKFTYPCILIALLAFASCKKDSTTSNPQNNGLMGDWNLVSMNIQTLSDEQYSAGGTQYRTVTASDYTTTNNQGYVTITADSMIGKGIGYSVATTLRAANYQNGVFTDSVTGYPFNLTIPPVNTASKYQLISSDSLYFPGGGLVSIPGSGNQTTQGAGYKYSISGTTLTMTTHINQNSQYPLSGVVVSRNAQATAVVTLQKK